MRAEISGISLANPRHSTTNKHLSGLHTPSNPFTDIKENPQLPKDEVPLP